MQKTGFISSKVEHNSQSDRNQNWFVNVSVMYFLSEARHVCVSLLKVTFVTDNGKFPISITRNHLKNFIGLQGLSIPTYRELIFSKLHQSCSSSALTVSCGLQMDFLFYADCHIPSARGWLQVRRHCIIWPPWPPTWAALC